MSDIDDLVAKMNVFRQSVERLAITTRTSSSDIIAFLDNQYHEERVFRKYVNLLNRNRPRGHKLSWRSLNRHQREDALNWFSKL